MSFTLSIGMSYQVSEISQLHYDQNGLKIPITIEVQSDCDDNYDD